MDQKPQITISNLSCGTQLLTEKSGFPSYSDIGICFRAGVRDERENERGSLNYLKQYLYRTNEYDSLDNFESVLRTGCLLDTNQDQELSYFKCSFLQEDLDHQLDTLFKLVFNLKHVSDQENQQIEKQDTPFDELIINTAFMGQLMGNCPSDGLSKLINEDNFVRFQKELFTPQNMAIGYAGILPHDEIKNIIENKLLNYPEFLHQRKLRDTIKAQFIPNILKQDTDSEEINIAIIYEGLQWSHPDMNLLQVLNSVVGNASSWSSGGPGKGMRSRATINMMNRIHCIESASSVNQHFTDTGLFGLKVSGNYKQSQELLNTVIKELRLLKEPMSDEEFNRGRNILNSQIQLNLERQADRLEESVKNFFTFGRLESTNYFETIQKVEKIKAQQFVKNLINNSLPAIIIQGKEASHLNIDNVVQSLRK